MKRRVVVTGIGAVTPIGNTVDEMWESILSSKTGIDRITHFDTSDYKVKLAAEVKNFDPDKFMTRKEKRSLDIVAVYAMAAAVQAAEMSGISPENITDPYRCGVMIGTASAGQTTFEHEAVQLHEKGCRAVSVFSMPKFLGNTLSGQVAIKYGFKGKCFNVASACATGTHAIGEAYRSISCGDCDIMFTGGADACITPLAVAGFQSLTALSFSDDPKRASIPFDKERNGFVMGEGAGVLILEEFEHAVKRNAPILGEIVGYGATCDAEHITAPNADGSAHAMTSALCEAGISCKDIDLINAHGTSTVANDKAETEAVRAVFGKDNPDIMIQSSKSLTGHMLGAAGAVECIICIKEMLESYVHENAGLNETEPEMDLNYVKTPQRNKKLRYVMSNSLAFGGQNGSLIIKDIRS